MSETGNDQLNTAEAASTLTETFDPYAPGVKHRYVCPSAPQLRTRFTGANGKDIHVHAEHGQFELDGPHAKMFDELLHDPELSIGLLVQKPNREEARALADRDDVIRRVRAMKGAANSSFMDAMKPAMAGSQFALNEAAPNNPAALDKFVDELAHGDLLVQEPNDSVNQYAQAPEVTNNGTGDPSSIAQPHTPRLNLKR